MTKGHFINGNNTYLVIFLSLIVKHNSIYLLFTNHSYNIVPRSKSPKYRLNESLLGPQSSIIRTPYFPDKSIGYFEQPICILSGSPPLQLKVDPRLLIIWKNSPFVFIRR